MNYKPRGNQLLQFDLVTHSLKPSVSEEDEISVALISEVRQFSGLFSAGLGVQVENLEALRQFLEVRLAADPSQVGGVHASGWRCSCLRLEVFMPPVLPHFSPPSDAMAAVPLDPARLGSTGPSSLVMRTGMLVPAVLGL